MLNETTKKINSAGWDGVCGWYNVCDVYCIQQTKKHEHAYFLFVKIEMTLALKKRMKKLKKIRHGLL